MERKHIGRLCEDRAAVIAPELRWGARVFDGSSDWEVVTLRRRIRAGVWSARVAFVLSVPFAVCAWVLGVEHAWLVFMLLPATASFFAGALWGGAICNSKQVSDGWIAGRRGALVALGAYVIFAAEMAVLSDAWLHVFFDSFMAAILVTGWLGLPAGFLAGLMTFRAREGATKRRRPVEPKPERIVAGVEVDTVAADAAYHAADNPVRHTLG